MLEVEASGRAWLASRQAALVRARGPPSMANGAVALRNESDPQLLGYVRNRSNRSRPWLMERSLYNSGRRCKTACVGDLRSNEKQWERYRAGKKRPAVVEVVG